ncbi:MAG: hypothetical protein AAB706_02980, partial [Patescibacteria group bacterium]
EFVGAYAANLMMHGDIDISVVRSKPFSIEEVFDIFRNLYFKGAFRSYFIGGDWDDPRKGKEFPHGYYIGMKQRVEDEKWKIDVWFIGEEDFNNREKEFNVSNILLTDEQKETILDFKQYRNKNKLSIPSQKIYETVLKHGCKTIGELGEFLNKQEI